MRLSEDRSIDFENFVHWLYAHDNQNSGSLPNNSYNLIRLYVIAEKYDIPALKKCICDRMIRCAKDKGSKPPGWDSIAYAYEYLPATSSLLKLLVDWHAWDMCLGLAVIETEKKELAENPKFAVDLVYATLKTARYRSHKGLFFWDTSEYYENMTFSEPIERILQKT